MGEESEKKTLTEVEGMSQNEANSPAGPKPEIAVAEKVAPQLPPDIERLAKVAEPYIEPFVAFNREKAANAHKIKELQEKNQWKQFVWDRVFALVALIAFIIVTVSVLHMFKDKPEVIVPILTGIGGFVAGLVGGIGIGKAKSGDK